MPPEMNDASSSGRPVSETVWSGSQRWLRVATMGRACARLYSQIRKYLVGVAAAAITLGLVLFGQLEWLEYRSLDWLFELRGALFERLKIPPATSPIVIIEIDEASIRELGAWPFRRATHAQLLDRISAWKPLVIGVDVIFPQPSRYGPQDDAAFSAGIARARNVVLGAACVTTVQVLPDVGPKGLSIPLTDCDWPLPVLREGAAGVGPVNVMQDNLDSQVRRAPLRMSVGDRDELSFDANLHRVATAAGFPTKPLPRGDEILVNFRGGAGTFPSISYYRIVTGEVTVEKFPDALRDKIVLIGSTTKVEHDIFPTVFARGDGMAGVEIHANVLQTLIRGDRILEVPKLASTVLAVVAALLGSVMVVRLRAFRALAIVVILLLVGALLMFAGFAAAHAWIRGMAITFGLVLGYGATVVENFVREQREKQRLSRFFSPDVLRAVVRDRDGRSLRPRRRLVTVLFSDIRGFTSISERLQPEQVDEMLREYLTVMTEVVFRHGGTVDKYIGDAIMGLYNAPYEDPEHALKAIRTALEFQERAIPFSARWQAKLGVTIRCGVGINSGEAVVGSLGSRQRNEYTAIGDTVNLAARLESITKDYNVPIIISEYTYEHVKRRFPTHELDTVTVKGKSQPVKIYGVMPSSMRKHPRATLDAAVQLTAADGSICRVRTFDISEGGVGLLGVPAEWPLGSKIEVRLDGGELGHRIVAEGAIVSRRGEKAGVQFTSLDASSAPAVAEYVARGRNRDETDEVDADASRR
jgi:adenylate cyclase